MTTLTRPAAVRIGPEGLPPVTLGWQVLQWTADYLLQPDGPLAGEPWRFTDEQARFVLWWYAIDGNGRFAYRYGMLRRMKGWGKDPVGAALCCVEFVGPCRFAGWRNGEPKAAPHSAAWVQTAAVARDQTRNTMTLFPGMLSPRAIEEYGIDLGKEIIYAFHGRARIEAVTSSPRALEGGRATFVLKNETHHWLQNNEGLDMAAVIARNLAKSRDGSARALAISNAHNPGEGSDAEQDWETWQKIDQGLSLATGFLYDSLEAPVGTALDDAGSLRSGLLAARGDSAWLDIERLSAEIQDPRTKPATARRFYLNQISAEEDKPFSLARWHELERPDYVVKDRALITLGFDGSLSRDWTALIATEVATGYQWPLGIWQPRPLENGDMRIPIAEVDAAVAEAFRRWNVWRFYCDPYKWFDQLSAWAGRHGDKVVVEWKTTTLRQMALALLAYQEAINGGQLSHSGDQGFTAGIGNARKHLQSFTDDDGERLWTIEKDRPDSPFKIDPAIAGCLSWRAALDAVASGALEHKIAGVFFI